MGMKRNPHSFKSIQQQTMQPVPKFAVAFVFRSLEVSPPCAVASSRYCKVAACHVKPAVGVSSPIELRPKRFPTLLLFVCCCSVELGFFFFFCISQAKNNSLEFWGHAVGQTNSAFYKFEQIRIKSFFPTFEGLLGFQIKSDSRGQLVLLELKPTPCLTLYFCLLGLVVLQ